MRTRYSMLNMIVGGITKVLNLLIGFFCRTVFIRLLGQEYLGLNGLFSNILSLLSLSELGFGTSIIYMMYKADAEKDVYQKKCLLTFYAKIYTLIGCIILLLSILATPFLPWLIKNNTYSLEYLQKIFLLQSLNSAMSYFFSYRSSLIFVAQKDYLLKLILFGCNLCCSSVQIALLAYKADYITYLIVQIIFTFLNNIIIYFVSKKLYPEIQIGREYKLDKNTYEIIRNKVSSLLSHNISGFVTNGTDNIIISKMIGILEVGKYSNYNLVISGITSVLDVAMKGVTASLGNFMAQKGKKDVYRIYQKIDFAFYFINSICTLLLSIVLREFMVLWIGKESLFPLYVEFILICNFYIVIQRKAIFTVRNAGGLFSNDKNAAIIKPCINLFVSIYLTYKIGIVGVFIGTMISGIIIDVIWMPYIVYKKYFQVNFYLYLVDYLKKITILLIEYGITKIVCEYFNFIERIWKIFFEGGISCAINFLVMLCFYRKDTYDLFCDIKKAIKR